MIVKCFTCNDFAEQCYVLSNDSNEAIVIDPGFCYDSERDAFYLYVKEEHLSIKHVLNTHLHVDHILGNRYIEDTFGIGASACDQDEPLLENMRTYAQMFGLLGRSFTSSFFSEKLEALPLAHLLKAGETVSIKDIELEVLHIPGHTLGHLAFLNRKELCVFVGDILFKGSIGRTDLAGGNPTEMQKLLVEGIRKQLLSLPDETVVFSGHGESSTIGYERENNPYL